MSSSRVDMRDARAVKVRVLRDRLVVLLADGREVRVPLEWFPKLRDASYGQRQNWRLVGGGIGIHWVDIDEDILVEELLRS